MWTYNSTTVGLESAYGGNYPTGVAEICDGKLYLTNGEHSPTQPLMRGQNLRCIDATTGKEIWKILGYFGGMSPTSYNSLMADGIFVGLNYFDMQLYAIGKGPSGTTISAPQVVPTLGSSVMITGTVTDQTATGRRTTDGSFEFSLKGTPAISDASMSAWMEYMFMQQTKPTDATGVPVSLTAIDPNGNLIPIGQVTSDSNGAYGCKFTPRSSRHIPNPRQLRRLQILRFLLCINLSRQSKIQQQLPLQPQQHNHKPSLKHTSSQRSSAYSYSLP